MERTHKRLFGITATSALEGGVGLVPLATSSTATSPCWAPRPLSASQAWLPQCLAVTERLKEAPPPEGAEVFLRGTSS